VDVAGTGGERVRMRIDILDRHDGVYIVRMKLFGEYSHVTVIVTYNGEHVADSPYKIKGKQTRFVGFIFT
jgi:hypothetical protein